MHNNIAILQTDNLYSVCHDLKATYCAITATMIYHSHSCIPSKSSIANRGVGVYRNTLVSSAVAWIRDTYVHTLGARHRKMTPYKAQCCETTPKNCTVTERRD